MITGNIGFTSLKSKLNKWFLNQHHGKGHVDVPSYLSRRSVLEDNTEMQVSPPHKNYKSSKDLDFYQTAPTNENDTKSTINRSSIECTDPDNNYLSDDGRTKKTMLNLFKTKVISGKQNIWIKFKIYE